MAGGSSLMVTGHIHPESLVQALSEAPNFQVPNKGIILNISVRAGKVKCSSNWEINHFINREFSIPCCLPNEATPKCIVS